MKGQVLYSLPSLLFIVLGFWGLGFIPQQLHAVSPLLSLQMSLGLNLMSL